jgi:hypothetical protein
MIRWAAAGAARRRQRAGIPDQVRHREKWRLALDMIDEMTGPGGWGVGDLVTAAGAPGRWWPLTSPGDNAVVRQQLTDRGWQYAVAVKGSVSAHDGGAVPQARALRRPRPAAQARLPAPAGDPAHPGPRARRSGPARDVVAGHQGQ